MKLILTILVDIEMIVVYSILMMVLFLLHVGYIKGHPQRSKKNSGRIRLSIKSWIRNTSGFPRPQASDCSMSAWKMTGFGPKQARAAEKAVNAEHINWLKSIGAEDTELKTLAQFEDARYNNTDEYRLLTGYGRAVQKR